MRIQELRVHRYGPLADFSLTEVGDFTLVFGENESGKTLLLDAVLRFLLSRKRERELFSRLDRVEQDPDGFIDMLHAERTLRFPSEDSLPDLLGIHPEDLRNILVVRASDLQVQEDEQKQYYAGLTDRLMGIHRESINKTLAKLGDIGPLTPGGALADSQASGKIASRFKDANDLISKIEQLKEDLTDTELVELERRLLDAEEKRQAIEEELSLLRQAEKRELYETGERQLAELEKCVEGIDKLPAIERKHYDDWRDAENQIAQASQAIEETERELAGLQTELQGAHSVLEAAQKRLGQLEAKQSAVRDLDDEARRYLHALVADSGLSPILQAAPRAVILLGILFTIAVAAAVARPEESIFRVVVGILGGLFILSGLAWALEKVTRGRRRREWYALRLEAAKQGIRVEEFEALLEAIANFSAQLDAAQNALSEDEREHDRFEERMRSRREMLKDHGERIRKANEGLALVRESLGVNTLEELKSVQDELGRLDKKKQKLLTELRTRFGEVGDDLDEMLETWRRQVSQLAEFKGAAQGVEPNEARHSDLQVELEVLDGTIDESREVLEADRSEIADIANKTSIILRAVEPLPGDTFEDLLTIERALRVFAQEVEVQSTLAMKAIDILHAIQADEEQRVKGLFSEDDLASRHFRTVTNGAYERVDYDPESGELIVIRPNEEALRAYALSSGTYDQLYMATRLSLAARLLGGEPGFFLLDDPFLTSDSKRLSLQLEILQDLAAEGWQIVYFSVKEEVRDCLEEAIAGGRIDLRPLEPLVEPG